MEYQSSAVDDKDCVLAGYLHENELAKELGVTRATIRRWKALGEAPTPTRIGRKVFYARKDVVGWLESCRVAA